MKDNEVALFDVGIIGGGLSGLALSILLARAEYKVILVEKEKYPFHKVCGEYISLESYSFIESLGLALSGFHLPVIKKLLISSPNGNTLHSNLDMGGIGISRYLIDNELKGIAADLGVTVIENKKVTDVIFHNEYNRIQYDGIETKCKVVAGSYGKKSNLDVKWSRPFTIRKPGKLNNYIGVKYHIRLDFPADTIALHNFKNGYCGISKIEGDRYCLCYLTTAQNLKDNQNSIHQMEQNVLCKNPFLQTIFSEASFLFEEPLVISQISFDTKSQVENHILMTGDSAGMITPLCGNGMSIAMHSSKLAFGTIHHFLRRQISRAEMEKKYVDDWNRHFKKRLKNGRMIQKLFGRTFLTNVTIGTLKQFPEIVKKLIAATHGSGF